MLQSGRPLFSDITLNTQRHESIFATTTGVSRGCSVAIRGGRRRSLAISSESIVWLWIFLFIILVESPCYLRALRCRGLRPTSLLRRAISRRSLREATRQLAAVGCDSGDISATAFVAVWVVGGLAGLLSSVRCSRSPLSCSVDPLNCLLSLASTTMEHVLKLSGVIGRISIIGGNWNRLAAIFRGLVLFNIGIIFLRNRVFNFFSLIRTMSNLSCWSTRCSVHHPAIFLAGHILTWYWIFIIVCLYHFWISFDPSRIVYMPTLIFFRYQTHRYLLILKLCLSVHSLFLALVFITLICKIYFVTCILMALILHILWHIMILFTFMCLQISLLTLNDKALSALPRSRWLRQIEKILPT